MTLYHVTTGRSFGDIEQQFANSGGYAPFKEAVAEAVVEFVRPIRDRYTAIRTDQDGLLKVLADGAEKARDRARKTVRKVYKKTGFVQI
jgi:tryptophanyl-tRNA synthetase